MSTIFKQAVYGLEGLIDDDYVDEQSQELQTQLDHQVRFFL